MNRHFDKQFGLRIKGIRNHLGLIQTEFGKLFGVTQEAVSFWERGGYPDSQMLLKIAKRGDTNVEWLLTGKKERTGKENIPIKKQHLRMNEFPLKNIMGYKPTPLLLDHVSNGSPKIITQEHVEEFLWLPPLFWNEHLYLIRMRDNGMDPILKQADVVGIREWFKDISALEGIITAVWLPEDGITIGWLSTDKNQWVLDPQNHQHSKCFIQKKKGIRFFRVIGWWRFPRK
jgi:transcriptional regulator with XRE-family HTH domain